MKLLIDTHIYIWLAENSQRLDLKIKQQIEKSSEVYISIASVWEIAIKRSLGKLEFEQTMYQIFKSFNDQKINLLQISKRHLEILETLPLHHRDPFDRLIIAQATAEGMTIVSQDQHFSSYDVKIIQ